MRLLLAWLAFVAALVASGPAAAAWNADWTKRSKIALDTSATGVQTNAPVDGVPVLVRLHTGNFGFLDAQPDGADLRFIAADDKTPLKFHVEKFDGLNELALVWVLVPRLQPGRKDEFIWVYYGNPKAPPAGDGKTGYDAAQALVFHFAETTGPARDATANGNHATQAAAGSAAGLIDGAAVFDGKAVLAVPASPSLQAANGRTVSFWMKADTLDDGVLFRQQDAASSFAIALKGGKLQASAGRLVLTANTAPAAQAWTHVAVVAGAGGLTAYVNGQEAGRAEGSVGTLAGEITIGAGYQGQLDELQVANTARSADWLVLAARGQAPDAKFALLAPAEGGAGGEGQSYLRILLQAVTLDGWIVIGILMVMMVVSFWVMISKTITLARAAKANERFMAAFRGSFEGAGARIRQAAAGLAASPLYRLYRIGDEELQQRMAATGARLSPQSLEAIRASVDARMVREQQRLNSQMVLLTISIAGGPFLGLLGTVVGVMITFAAIAAAGDVNVNAIAPGIAAALVATVAGLAVAIPALFGYNYLTGRVGNLSADMQVFVDEMVTRFAENHAA